MKLAPINRAGALTLTPETELVAVGAEACVAARATDTGAQPIFGARVDFTVAGAHARSHSATTDAQGAARFCYVGGVAGSDTIEVSLAALSAQANKVWLGTNHAPVAAAAEHAAVEDEPLQFTLMASDADGDALTYTIVDAPQNGTLSGTAPSLTYTPQAGFSGSDRR